MQARVGQTAIADSSAPRALREPALFALAIILMVSFSLFPRGFMPARTAHGGFTIVLCSAAGLAPKQVDAPARTPRRHIGSENCDLVSASAAMLPPAVSFLEPLAVLAPLTLWTARAFEARLRTPFDPNAPPTAPPLLKL